MAVLPADRRQTETGGIYYHADCSSPITASEPVSDMQTSVILGLTSGSIQFL